VRGRGRLALRHLVPALAAAAVAGAVAVVHPGPLADLDLAAHDAFVRQTPAPPPSSAVAIVAVDEASLAAHGQWPWPRDVVGRLVTALHEAGATAVAFDILFPEPDRLGTPGMTPGDATSTDTALATAMREARVVTGVALTFEAGSRPPSPCVLAPVSPIVRHRGNDDPLAGLFTATGAVCSVPVLGEAARATGTINATPDGDGVLRRIPVLTHFRGQVQSTLALAAVTVASPAPVVVERRSDGVLVLAVGQHTVRLDAQGQILLRPRGPGRTYPHLSARDVLAGTMPAGALRGRIVFVGATALGVRDVVATALDPRFPGVELHASIADALLGGASAERPAAARLLELAGPVAGALVGAALVAWLGGMGGAAACLAVAGLAWLGPRGWFAAAGAVVSPVGTMAGLALGALASVAAELAFERRRANAELGRREQAQRLIVQTLTSLTETRDVETGRHARRTQEYTRVLAASVAARGAYRDYLTPHRIDLIATLAPLHDIGKVGISDAVLHKPGVLTESEYAEMKQHTTLGHETLRKAEALAGVHDNEVLSLAKDIVFTHHERWDGSGYPQGLRGEAIPIPGRLVAVVDTYDALVARRAYKEALPHDQAIGIIRDGRGTHFDPVIVDAFLDCHTRLREAEHAADVRLTPPGR
jgi:CHASE2 domain-containing sensor protein